MKDESSCDELDPNYYMQKKRITVNSIFNYYSSINI